MLLHALRPGNGRRFGELSGRSNPEASILFDTGHSLSFGPPFLKTSFPVYRTLRVLPSHGMEYSSGVGAKLARPDHAAVVFMGDGAFLMTGTTLATALEYDIPLVVVVFNNATLQI